MKTAVLLLVFSRLEPVRRVLAAIAEAQPPRLYIAADGPRKNMPNEAQQCQEVRDYVLENVDWDCEVFTLFRDENLGCGRAISGALKWFFGAEEEGIILEDDTCPTPDFFEYCEELLARYRHCDDVWMIAGTHHDFFEKHNPESYYFSGLSHIWGWATWRRSIEAYDYELRDLNFWQFLRSVRRQWHSPALRFHWVWLYLYYRWSSPRRWSSWAYQYSFNLLAHNKLGIQPNGLLVENLGFGADSTHTRRMPARYYGRVTQRILPLVHPAQISKREDYDRRSLGRYGLIGAARDVVRAFRALAWRLVDTLR